MSQLDRIRRIERAQLVRDLDQLLADIQFDLIGPSPEVDMRIARALQRMQGQSASLRVRRYTRSLDAALPGESIRDVGSYHDDGDLRWTASQNAPKSEHGRIIAFARTEALARRAARLRQMRDELHGEEYLGTAHCERRVAELQEAST